MEKRIQKVTKVLAEYSEGKFKSRLNLSSKLDAVDGLFASINMLGEELNEKTISRNYLSDIIESLEDLIFVFDENFYILFSNNSNRQLAGQKSNSKPILLDFFPKSFCSLLKQQIKKLSSLYKTITFEKEISFNDGKKAHTLISIRLLKSNKKNYILSIKDISKLKEIENSVIRRIVETQEAERARIAKDLHDSIGQQLSSVRFYISSLSGKINEKNKKLILKKANEVTLNTQFEIRSICFNLVPVALENIGLKDALVELFSKINLLKKTQVELNYLLKRIVLPKNLKLTIYRIIQEFVTNSIKHGDSKNIYITISNNKTFLLLELEDNGRGFNFNRNIIYKNEGHGIRNLFSRVEAYNGSIDFYSKKNCGTKCSIIFNFSKMKS